MRAWTGYLSVPRGARSLRHRRRGTPKPPCGGVPDRSIPAPVLLLCALLLAGCAGSTGTTAAFTASAVVTRVQACAIGYDLARQVHDRISLRRTVLLAPSRASPCEAHALDYLRRAGFRIDETGRGGARFTIALARLDPGTLSAVARIGDDLTIARLYRPARTGVVALGPVSVQHLDPDRYGTPDAAGGAGS